MNKALKIYLWGFVLLIVAIVAIDRSRVAPVNWSQTYFLNEKKPFDLYVLNKEIDNMVADTVVRYVKNPYEYFQELDSFNVRPETYLFLKNYIFLDEAMVRKILYNVKQGSSLFVVSDGFAPHFLDSLGVYSDYMNYTNPLLLKNPLLDKELLKLTFSREAWGKKDYVLPSPFGQYAFIGMDTLSSKALGYMTFPDDTKYINFIEVQLGKGKVFLHTQPSAFTNYSLLSGDSLQEYAEKVLSYIPDQPLVWFVERQGDLTERPSSQLSVIFKYPALKMTWLIFLYGLIGFVFFTAKRRQRVVPVIKPLENTTVEFVKTISNLYLQEGDMNDVARKKIIYFLDRLRLYYHIDTQGLMVMGTDPKSSGYKEQQAYDHEAADREFIQRLHLKSGKEKALIEEIVTLMRNINRAGQCDKASLTLLSRLIDRFWDTDNENKQI